MSKIVSLVLGGFVIAASLTLGSGSFAGDSKVVVASAPPAPPSTVVGIARVTWGLSTPGGVGTFRVAVTSTGPLRAGAVWVQAVSPGAPTLQGPVGAAAKPSFSAVGAAAGTANGRCYDVVLAIEPDSASAGIALDPKNSRRRVCLDPDGAGIYN